MISVFYYQVNNTITNIIRNRIIGDILRDTVNYNVWKKGIQNLSCVFIIWNNSLSSINVIFFLDIIMSERKG